MKRTRNQYHYQIRRVKLLADQIRSNKLLEAALSGNTDLLKEMKRVKSSGKVNQPDHVDKKINQKRSINGTFKNYIKSSLCRGPKSVYITV